MTKLISIDDFSTFREITENIDAEAKLDPYILEAQRYDLKPYLGDVLFFDFIKNSTQQIYVDLLNGKEYNNASDHLIIFEGVKPALVYFSYARFIKNVNHVVTAESGLVQKGTEFSKPVDNPTLARKSADARDAAVAEMSCVERFLNDNYTSYPLYRRKGSQRTGGGVRIRAVGGNSDNSDNYYNRHNHRGQWH